MSARTLPSLWALILSHPAQALGQRLLPLAWPCGHLSISSDFQGRDPSLSSLCPLDSSFSVPTPSLLFLLFLTLLSLRIAPSTQPSCLLWTL